MKCQAKTSEGKRCSLNASAEVGGGHFCGNHAAKVRATQLKDAPQQERQTTKPEQPESVLRLTPFDEQLIADIFKLIDAGVSRTTIANVLRAWKAGI